MSRPSARGSRELPDGIDGLSPTPSTWTSDPVAYAIDMNTGLSATPST